MSFGDLNPSTPGLNSNRNSISQQQQSRDRRGVNAGLARRGTGRRPRQTRSSSRLGTVRHENETTNDNSTTRETNRDDETVVRIAEDNNETTMTSRDMAQIHTRISHLLHALTSTTAQLSQLTTRTTETPEKEQLDELSEKARSLITEIGGLLKQGQQNQDWLTPSQKLRQKKLTNEFEEAGKRFQSVARVVAGRTRELVRKLKAASPTSPQHEYHDKEEHDETSPLLQHQHQLQIATLDPTIELNEHLIAEREAEIRDIERSIVEVNEIFRGLGAIVVEQGEMLDNIESNVVSIHANVENAAVEVRKANKYQKALSNWKCWFMVVLLVVILVLLLVFRPWRR